MTAYEKYRRLTFIEINGSINRGFEVSLEWAVYLNKKQTAESLRDKVREAINEALKEAKMMEQNSEPWKPMENPNKRLPARRRRIKR